MNVVVTGATGFVGRHVVSALLRRGHTVTAVARTESKARALAWHPKVRFIECDIHRDPTRALAEPADALVHLAWPGLPNYKDSFHLDVNLPADLAFLDAAVAAGIRRLVVAGTCLEYGLLEGGLADTTPTQPTTPYGQAKDALRMALEERSARGDFSLQWVRLFYMHGEGQNPNSLLSQLDRAIDEGRETFDMSHGEQLRDYLPIEAVAEIFAKVVETPGVQGVINCSSGRPVSVLEFVKAHAARRGSEIRLNRGRYPVPDYEPLAFWGIPTSLEATRDEATTDRMRLLESLRETDREIVRSTHQAHLLAQHDARATQLEAEHARLVNEVRGRDAELSRLTAEVINRDAEIVRLNAVLSQWPHRLVSRAAGMMARLSRRSPPKSGH